MINKSDSTSFKRKGEKKVGGKGEEGGLHCSVIIAFRFQTRISEGPAENTDGVCYLWIHVIENTEESTLAGIGWNMTKKISTLDFTIPKSIRKLQCNLERERERDGIKEFHSTPQN